MSHQSFQEIEHFTIEDIAGEISKLKQKKIPGFDLITVEVLKKPNRLS